MFIEIIFKLKAVIFKKRKKKKNIFDLWKLICFKFLLSFLSFSLFLGYRFGLIIPILTCLLLLLLLNAASQQYSFSSLSLGHSSVCSISVSLSQNVFPVVFLLKKCLCIHSTIHYYNFQFAICVSKKNNNNVLAQFLKVQLSSINKVS